MTAAHPWLPQTPCDAGCIAEGAPPTARREVAALRVVLRATMVVMLATALPVLALPFPGRPVAQRVYCRLLLRCVGVRIRLSGTPIRNLPGVLVVSDHVSWLDVLTVGALVPAGRWRCRPLSFVARADMAGSLAIRVLARIVTAIPIDRASLRGLPAVVDTVAEKLRAGHTVVAFPEGTTWCGLAGGRFYPAMFQAAIDAGRPVQPLRLHYHHRDGRVSTVPAYVGDETLLCSIRRVLTAPFTEARIDVEPLQLPDSDRRELARRCRGVVRAGAGHQRRRRGQAPVSWAGHGVPRPRRHHPDAPRRHRGDDDCVE
ncbi:1-acyl-sn-glycerol-3-phosphate acyltransferase [Mycobacterium sp.]|uniref:lysophospholipid acyltransferase family protein n=1 Tax=Mycobacterium sp. TaxID=1785 RepID=UPI00127AC6C5|nr:lysophospholipid acyltransferase family protein [Mycobacterium sp.]KAA8964826.1 MAG: 1-acyl-sn-glycerol-3-phosphate acyltransferase [Mycobacterium sp.]